MSDRTSAYLFGEIFKWLAENPDDRSRKFAKKLKGMARDYDFDEYQMYCDDALKTLGVKDDPE